jgi:hypothetical protein
MSVSITRSPAEDAETIRQLLVANLFQVFGERDETLRTKAVASTYHEGVLWHEPDRIINGLEELDRRAGEILAETPGFKFSTDGEAIISQNMGIQSWNFGPEADPALVKGTDVIVVEGGKIKVLWTAVTKTP